MDKGKAIRILLFYRYIDEEISYNRRIIKGIEDDYYSMSGGGALDGQPRGKNHLSNPTEATALALPETAAETLNFWNKEIERLHVLKIAILIEINKLPFVQKRIVYDFYINGHKWVRISEQNHYSETQCKKIRNRGLMKLAEHFSRNAAISKFDFPE